MRFPALVPQGDVRSADARISYSSVKVFDDINESRLSPMMAYTTGKLAVKGDVGAVMGLLKRMEANAKAAEAAEAARKAETRRKRDAELTPRYGAAATPRRKEEGAGRHDQVSKGSQRWVDERHVTSCMGCAVPFNFINRKHHCRSCGGVFCNSCSPSRAPAKKRVCNGCFAGFYVSDGRPQAQKPAASSAGAAGASAGGGARAAQAHRRPAQPGQASAAQPGGPAPRERSSGADSTSSAHATGAAEQGMLPGGAGADAETAQLAERMAELEAKLRRLRQDAEAATLPLALPPSLEGAATSSELAAIVVYPLAYAMVLLGWRTVPLSLLGLGALLYWVGGVAINFAALALLLAGGFLWYASTAMGSWELMRRRLRVFGAAGVVFADYKLTQLRAADLQDTESGPLYNAVHRRSAVRSLVLFRELQGLWVKMGQYLSSRADVMPDQYTEVYSALQDSMPARPLEEVTQTLTEDLGKPIAELFDNLAPDALAAASIGQVHRATLKSGLEVAVKVKHRSIDRVLAQDLDNLNIILGWMSMLEPDVDISTVMEEWSKEVLRELDLENEARQMMRVRENLMRDGLPAFVPRIPEELFGKRALVMRFIDGVKMSTPIQELDRMGVDREGMCRSVLRAFAHQIYVDGLFNGDPHPGNIMVIQREALIDGDPADAETHREAARARARSGAVPAVPQTAAGLEDGTEDPVAPSSRQRGGGLSPVMDGDPTEWIPVLLDFGLTKLLGRHVRLAFCKMVLAGQELDGNMLMEAFDEMGMRFSNENVMEDMEGIKHMFRDAVPKEEARAQAKAKLKEDEVKKAKATESGTKQRKLEAWPGELILFLRVSELLNGLAAQLEVRVPTLQIMAHAARVGMLRRFPIPRVRPDRSAEQVAATRLALLPDRASASRGKLSADVFRSPMPGLPRALPGAASSSKLAATPIDLERAIRGCLRDLRRDGAILGAQVAVFRQGVCVADIGTGKMGPLDHRRVDAATRFPLFGLGRALVAAAVYDISKRRSIPLARTVASVWPEFAEGGKGGCSISDLLRCRSGVEGWLPENVQTSSLLDADGMAAGLASAVPRLLPTLADFDSDNAPGSTDDDADSVGDDIASPGSDAASASPRRPASRLKPLSWRSLPQGPTAAHESVAHLYFGWGWAAAELLRRVGDVRSAQEAIETSVGKRLSVAGELRLGAVKPPAEGEGSTGRAPEPVPGGGQDDGASSPPDEDVFAPVASVELCSEDELRTAAKAASRAASVSGMSERRSIARSASAGGGSGFGGAGDATAVGSGERDAEEDDAQADAHVMRTLMAAVALHSALARSGLDDLEGLVTGGKEHLVDPRAVNAKRVRGASLPNTTMFASARAVACTGASLMERLAADLGNKTFRTGRPGADGVMAFEDHDDRSRWGVQSSSEVTVGAVAAEACSKLGFRFCTFTSPDGTRDEPVGFAMGAMGGSILVCDPRSSTAVAVTVNRLLPGRGQSARILKAVFSALGAGVPTEALAGSRRL